MLTRLPVPRAHAGLHHAVPGHADRIRGADRDPRPRTLGLPVPARPGGRSL